MTATSASTVIVVDAVDGQVGVGGGKGPAQAGGDGLGVDAPFLVGFDKGHVGIVGDLFDLLLVGPDEGAAQGMAVDADHIGRIIVG